MDQILAPPRGAFLETVQGIGGRRAGAWRLHDPQETRMAGNDDVMDLPEDEPIPAMQQLLDNPFLLLFIGIAMPTVLYVVWGVMEIVNIPVAR
jgi:hypothetical protein